jgi:hypothetical protein
MAVHYWVAFQFYLLENLVKVPKDIAELPSIKPLSLLKKVSTYPCVSHAWGNRRSAWLRVYLAHHEPQQLECTMTVLSNWVP